MSPLQNSLKSHLNNQSSTMMKAVILDYKTLSPEDLELSSLWDLPFEWTIHDTTTAGQTDERISEADVILTNKVVLDRDLLSANPQIKYVIIMATGTNNVDLEAASELGIPVSNIIGYSTESVAQHTFAALLSLKRKLTEYRISVNTGEWSASPFFCLPIHSIQDLSGETLGLIGYGAIGKRVKELAEAFGMKVLISESLVPGSSKSDERVPLEKLYQESDVISLHCPLSNYSRNLIGEKQFSMMKSNAILLNMARGGIVNEADLFEALKNGSIAGSATDVMMEEPPSDDHILLKEELSNLLITPHVAWASRQARQNLVNQLAGLLESFLNGTVQNQVND
jgi:glycerate dehydrogenase